MNEGSSPTLAIHSLEHVARLWMAVNVTFVEWLIRIAGYELSWGQAERAMDLELQNDANKVTAMQSG